MERSHLDRKSAPSLRFWAHCVHMDGKGRQETLAGGSEGYRFAQSSVRQKRKSNFIKFCYMLRILSRNPAIQAGTTLES